MPFKVIESYDGCPGRELSKEIPDMETAKRVRRLLLKSRTLSEKESLDIIDTETERLVSFVDWPGRGGKGKGSILRQRAEREPAHNQSSAALIPEGGIYHANYLQWEREDDSLSAKMNADPFRKRPVNLLKKTNPFLEPTDIKEETSREHLVRLPQDVVMKPRLARPARAGEVVHIVKDGKVLTYKEKAEGK